MSPPQVEQVPCPYDVHHRVPRASLERHAASCRLRKMGYSAEEEVGRWAGGGLTRPGAGASGLGVSPARLSGGPGGGEPVSAPGALTEPLGLAG